MDYLEAASLLGQTILASETYVEFKESENALLGDEQAQKLLLEYRQLQEDVVKLARAEMDKDVLEKARKDLVEKNKELNTYPVTKRHFAAKMAFEQMMQEVNSVLEHYLSGGDSGNCTGSCETCSSDCGGEE